MMMIMIVKILIPTLLYKIHASFNGHKFHTERKQFCRSPRESENRIGSKNSCK